MHEMLKAAFSDNVMGRTQTTEWFLDSSMRKLWLKIVSIQVVCLQVAPT
jgi:hypothetical protein